MTRDGDKDERPNRTETAMGKETTKQEGDDDTSRSQSYTLVRR